MRLLPIQKIVRTRQNGVFRMSALRKRDRRTQGVTTVMSAYMLHHSRNRSLRAVTYILTVFPHNVQQSPKQMKGVVRKLLSRRRHISLSRVAIGKMPKSGISSPGSTTSDSDAMPTYKVNNAKRYVINDAGHIDVGP